MQILEMHENKKDAKYELKSRETVCVLLEYGKQERY
jgi:hypothetical protein